jgi:glycosyltransferase involved in cell wall biosynthesis
LTTEVILVDNASTDGSADIASQFGLKIVTEPRLGYGYSCRAGLNKAVGKYIILGDPDGSYDFREIPKLIKLLETADLVVGSRYLGQMAKKSMPWSHYYIGNPIIRLFLGWNGLKLKETSTGFIALRSSILTIINARSEGMEFSSEFLVKASKGGVKMSEYPTSYSARIGTSKIREMRDGLRHIFILTRLIFLSRSQNIKS